MVDAANADDGVPCCAEREAELGVLGEQAVVESRLAEGRDPQEPGLLTRIQLEVEAVGVLDVARIVDRRSRDGDRRNGARAEVPAPGVRPREEREQGTRPAKFVAEVEVVGARVVEVDGLLDEVKADRPVEVDRPARIGADGRDVMKNVELHPHDE